METSDLKPGNMGVWSGNRWIPLRSVLEHVVMRGSDVEAWIKAERDTISEGHPDWYVLDRMLDQYRLHADTGTPLDEPVSESDLRPPQEEGEVPPFEMPELPDFFKAMAGVITGIGAAAKALEDAKVFGIGALQRNEDGTFERVDPATLRIEVIGEAP